MDQSHASSGSNAFSGITGMTLRNVTNQSGKRKGPPICYRPRQPAADPLPSDGTMTFTVIRQLKESVEVQNQLRLDRKLCDVVLVCGEIKYHCHKVVLASASPYFNAMFTMGMIECGKKEVPINNIDPDILGYIIQFIYTAEIKLTEQTICRLMQAATMLQMPHIIEACTTFLEHQLHPTNCIGIGKFAQQYGCIDLQKKAERYLLKHFVDIYVCEEFHDLTFEELEKMVGSNQLIVKCESEVYKAVMSWVAARIADRCHLLPQLLDKIRLCNIPPNFIKDQLNYCEILRKAPTSCAEKLAKLFQQLEMHTADTVAAPRNCSEKTVIYCIGGYLRHSVSNVEYFNPVNGEWRRVADTSHPRSGLAACTILGYIYAVGGRNSNERNEDLNIVDCYNPRTNEWCSMPPMQQRRNRVSVAALDNKLFAVGGSCGVEAFSSAECFDPSTREWISIANMNSKRIAAGLTVVNRFLYAVGGSNGSTRLSSMEKYHPEQNRWFSCPSMSTARSGTGVASLDSYIYVAGGFDSTTQLSLVERFDTKTEQWERVADMRHARSALNMVASGGKLYALGGYGGNGFVDIIEQYNPQTNAWNEVGRMLSGRSGQGVTLGPQPIDS